jgi:hypothetical protein
LIGGSLRASYDKIDLLYDKRDLLYDKRDLLYDKRDLDRRIDWELS